MSDPEVIDAQIVTDAIIQKPRERASVLLAPVMDIAQAKQRLAEFQEFVQGYMIEGEDYGKIPGTPKPTLYKPGADKLCELYGLSDDYAVLTKVEDFSAEPPLFDYTIKCILKSRRDDSLVSTGLGSCNSYEGKYKYRETKRKCTKCGKETVIKGKEQYGGGWLCWAKAGKSEGCGAKWPDGDQVIEGQQVGKTINDDLATLKNTILKMAKKRAKVDATLAATRSSGIFTQDMEDIGDIDDGSGTKRAAQSVGQAKVEAKKEVTVEFHVDENPEKSCTFIMGPGCALIGNVLRSTGKHNETWGVWTIPGKDTRNVIKACEEQGIKVLQGVMPGKSSQVGQPVRTDEGSASSVTGSARHTGAARTTGPVNLPPVGQRAPALGNGKTIKSVEVRQGKKVPYAAIVWGEEECSCFDPQIFELVKAGDIALFEVKFSKGYHNISELLSLNGETYSRIDGNLARDIHYQAADNDLPEVMR